MQILSDETKPEEMSLYENLSAHCDGSNRTL